MVSTYYTAHERCRPASVDCIDICTLCHKKLADLQGTMPCGSLQQGMSEVPGSGIDITILGLKQLLCFMPILIFNC